MRTHIALLICLLSALILGYFCVFQGRSAVETGVELWLIWFQVASWLGERSWLRNLPLRGIYHSAKRGSLRLTGLALGIERASFVWLAAAGILFFAR